MCFLLSIFDLKLCFSFQLKDVEGREMRVKFSVQMNTKKNFVETFNTTPLKTIFYEGPHKVYVGNLSKSAAPEDLRHLFGKFGNVASVRVLQDLKLGKSRVYAFVSYLSQSERDAAMSLNGTVKYAYTPFHYFAASNFTCLYPMPSFVLEGIFWSNSSR
jgi:polyadenylate-binding protein